MGSKISACIELTKPRIAAMVLVTALFGFVLGGGGAPDALLLAVSLAGIGLAGCGASALNQYLERDTDALMHRTRNRPLPAGTLSPAFALGYGVVLTLGGTFLLLFQVNMLSAFLALLSAFLYVLVYTPMKRFSWWNTVVGAAPGAMPPLIGWAAATGSLDTGAWILSGILFVWQFPHFYAIAWMYREDYARAGIRMLPVVKPDGRSLFAQTVLFSLALIPVSALPYAIGMSGGLYLAGAMCAGLVMLVSGIAFARKRTIAAARTELRVSIVYLPVLMILIAADMAW